MQREATRTNDPAGTKYNESFVRNLGRPVVVCDPVGRLIVLYRDNAGSNGLTIVHSLPYAVDPQRTNWTTFDPTTVNGLADMQYIGFIPLQNANPSRKFLSTAGAPTNRWIRPVVWNDTGVVIASGSLLWSAITGS